MEIIIGIVVVVAIAALLVFRNSAGKGLEVLDVNKDGKVDLEDAKAAVVNTKAAVKTRAQRKNRSNGNNTKP
jgi:hypothetical protein